METSFYSQQELLEIGFRSVGNGARISRRASIFNAGAISIGQNVRVDDYCVLAGGTTLTIGSHVHLACYCGLFAGSGIVLEDFSGLSAHVLVYSESDDYSGESLTNPNIPAQYKPGMTKGKVTIGRHVIIGARSTILPGIEIGEGAAVGAHSLVTKNCQAWWIYFGVPARKLRRRHQKLLLLEAAFRASL